MRHVVGPENGVDPAVEIREAEIALAEVDGDRAALQTVLLRMVPGPADLLEDIEIKLVEKPCLAERRDELRGLEEAVDRIIPAGQYLCAGYLAGEHADDRLIEEPDPAFLDGLVDMGDEVVSHHPAGFHLRLEALHGKALVAFRLLGGKPGAINGNSVVSLGSVQGVDAGIDADGPSGAHLVRNLPDDPLGPAVLDERDEPVRREPGGKLAAEAPPDGVGEGGKQGVPCGEAVVAVVFAEVQDAD